MAKPRKTSARSKPKRKAKVKSKFTAKTADKHVLYQLSVQDAATEVRFISRVFKKLRGRPALTMREDFCGTALFCADWVKSNKERTALGIDLDAKVLAWAEEHNLKPLAEASARVKLLKQDVRAPVKERFDVAVGFNFSYWVFKTRDDLRRYFMAVYRSLEKDGLFFLDTYGGYEAQEAMVEPRKIKGGFTYIWDQEIANPIDNSALNHIHFEFRDGTKIKKAFTYDWRFWSIVEIREILQEAGFKRSTVYWEGEDEDGEGTGIFRPAKVVKNEPAWVAYIMAER